MTAGADASGSKNDIQAISSTVTYLQRYTLLAATGLTSAEMDQDDDDGAGPERITEKQAADLNALISEVGADKARFLTFIKADSIANIRASSYSAAVAALESKRKRS
jgi:hypothetical protein